MAGLRGVVNALEEAFDSPEVVATGISRADFWAICAVQAVQQGRKNSAGKS